MRSQREEARLAPAMDRKLRAWPLPVSAIARWCRAVKMDAIPEADVLGANEAERKQLAALGGVAAAFGRRSSGRICLSSLPPAVRDWLTIAPIPPDDLMDGLQAELAGEEDPLALLYERIVSGARRRRLGTFFTPKPVLDYMRGIVRSAPRPRTVADPGAGVGAFTLASRKWWPEADVHAVDINLVTLGMLATRPESLATELQKGVGRLRVRHEDFFSWLTTTWPDLPGPRLILGNPPYVRHQKMSSSNKIAAKEATCALAPGGRSGLSTYFLAAVLVAIERSDSLCLLLPANWLEADYARSVREHLWRCTRRRVDLHLFPNELNLFPGAQVSAMVILVGPETTTRQPVRIVQVSGSIDRGFVGTHVLAVQRQQTTPRLFSPEEFRSTGAPASQVDASPSVPLGEIVVVRRGVATGANSFFLRTRSEADTLPQNACVSAISRLRHFEGNVLDKRSFEKLSADGAKCWLLRLAKKDRQDTRVSRLIDAGEADELHERFLCKARNPWYSVEQIPVPDILVGPMGKGGFRIVLNEVGAIPTNTLYGLRLRYRHCRSFPNGMRALAQWLRSTEGQSLLRLAARKHHGDGVFKIEPGALAQVKVPLDVATATSSLAPTFLGPSTVTESGQIDRT